MNHLGNKNVSMGAIQFSALKVIRSILKRRVAVSVQASQDKQNNSVKHSQTVSLPCIM